MGHHVCAGEVVGGGRQGHAGHARVALVQHTEVAVVGPEVVAPLAHAVCLVDGKQRQQPALVQRIEQRQKAGRGQALGRGVQKGEFTAQQLFFYLCGFVHAQAAVQERGRHPGLVQRAHLVVHQRNEGRHHHADALARAVFHDGGHLVTQAFAAARGHEHQRIAAAQHMRHDVCLRPAKGGVAKHLFQHRVGVLHGAHRHSKLINTIKRWVPKKL